VAQQLMEEPEVDSCQEAMAEGRSNGVGCGCAADQAAALQRRTLWVVLVINAAMFVVELAFGLRAGSTGLIANSLDMLAIWVLLDAQTSHL
jgi:Co/Zn/Cd efflux system component